MGACEPGGQEACNDESTSSHAAKATRRQEDTGMQDAAHKAATLRSRLPTSPASPRTAWSKSRMAFRRSRKVTNGAKPTEQLALIDDNAMLVE